MCYVAFKENLKVLSCPSTPLGMSSSNKDLYQNHGFTTSQLLRVLRGLKGTTKISELLLRLRLRLFNYLFQQGSQNFWFYEIGTL